MTDLTENDDNFQCIIFLKGLYSTSFDYGYSTAGLAAVVMAAVGAYKLKKGRVLSVSESDLIEKEESSDSYVEMAGPVGTSV